MATHIQSAFRKSEESHSKTLIFSFNRTKELAFFIDARYPIQQIIDGYPKLIEYYKSIIHRIKTKLRPTVSYYYTRQYLVCLGISQWYYKGVNSIANVLDIKLSPNNCYICRLGSSSYPEFHGISRGRMNDDFSLFIVIVGLSEDAPNIGAMHKFSEAEATNIIPFACPLIVWLMLSRAQSFNCLDVKRVVNSQPRYQIQVIKGDSIGPQSKFIGVIFHALLITYIEILLDKEDLIGSLLSLLCSGSLCEMKMLKHV